MKPFLTIPSWHLIDGLVHGFGTSFPGTCGLDEDDPVQLERAKQRTVREARDKAANFAGNGFLSVLTVKQTHSTDLLVIDRHAAIPKSDSVPCDGIITDRPGLLVGVKTADCVPILIFEPIRKVAAAVHAGWRGVIGGILEKAINTMKQDFGCDSSRMHVGFGPAARSCCYEVSSDLAHQFEEVFGEQSVVSKMPRPHLNMFVGLRQQALQAGVPSDNIADLGLCTICSEEPLFYSWRRDGQKTGRLLHVIGWQDVG